MRLSQDLHLQVRAVLRNLAMKASLNYGVRSPPKFTVWIINCSFKFSTSTLEFYSWINILHSSFKIHINYNVFLHLPFSFWTKLVYLALFAVHFQPDKQIFIHCYFLLVMMPEPVLYIWLAFDTHSPQRRIFSTKLLTLCLRFSDHWSRQKKPLWGWEMATYRPPPPALSFSNTWHSPQAKILLALLKRKAFN